MQSMTHREYLTWLAWLEDQWNVPDRTDYYLMPVSYTHLDVYKRQTSSLGSHPPAMLCLSYLLLDLLRSLFGLLTRLKLDLILSGLP